MSDQAFGTESFGREEEVGEWKKIIQSFTVEPALFDPVLKKIDRISGRQLSSGRKRNTFILISLSDQMCRRTKLFHLKRSWSRNSPTRNGAHCNIEQNAETVREWVCVLWRTINNVTHLLCTKSNQHSRAHSVTYHARNESSCDFVTKWEEKTRTSMECAPCVCVCGKLAAVDR